MADRIQGRDRRRQREPQAGRSAAHLPALAQLDEFAVTAVATTNHAAPARRPTHSAFRHAFTGCGRTGRPSGRGSGGGLGQGRRPRRGHPGRAGLRQACAFRMAARRRPGRGERTRRRRRCCRRRSRGEPAGLPLARRALRRRPARRRPHRPGRVGQHDRGRRPAGRKPNSTVARLRAPNPAPATPS